MTHSIHPFLASAVLSVPAILHAAGAPVRVTLDPTCVRSIGGITEFDQAQFITIHASPRERKLPPADYRYLRYDLEVSYGRDGGNRTWERGQTREAPDKPGFPDIAHIRERGAAHRKADAESGVVPRDSRDIVLCTHPELYYSYPGQKHATWSSHSMAAAAEFTANYMLYHYTNEARPRFLEDVPVGEGEPLAGAV